MFDKKCLRLGLITMCCAVIASFLPALYLWLFHGVIPSPPDIASIAGMMAASFAVGWVVQPITFYPALGVGASCLSWTTGNVGDLRMPAISAAQKAAEVEAGTPEGNVLSTMAILPASVTDAFSYIAPAIFGAIVIDYAMKNLRFNVPLIIAAFITYAVLSMLGLSSVWITLLVVIIGMFVSRGVFMIQSKKTEK